MRNILYFLFASITLFNNSIVFAEDKAPTTVTSPWDLEEKQAAQAPNPDRFYQEFLHMLMILSIILIILFAVTWFLKRMMNVRVQQINSTSPIKIVEQRALSAKTSIYVVDIFDKRFAIAESHSGVTALGELSETLSKSDFAKLMEK